MVTALRVANSQEISIVTYYRVDEILAGACLALTYAGKLGTLPRQMLRSTNSLLLVGLLMISCHPETGAMNYLRPYLAAMLIGTTLENQKSILVRPLGAEILAYIAAISYALYVIHPLLNHTWLGSGDGLEKYLKRPLLFAAIFGAAHISTFYFENRWIAFGKRFSGSRVH
jgi:peptidoglycan/LPS O-acetylase OafA/YrhL